MEPERLNLALNFLLILPDTEQRIDERFAHPLPTYDPQSPSVIQYRSLNQEPHHSNIAPVADDDASYDITSIGNPPAPAASLINPEQEASGHAAVVHSGPNEIPQRPPLSRERTLEWLGEISGDLPVDPQLLPHGTSHPAPAQIPQTVVQTHPAPLQMHEDEHGVNEQHEHEHENEDHENGHDGEEHGESRENDNGNDHEGGDHDHGHGNGNHYAGNHHDSGYEDNDDNHHDSGYEENGENGDDQHEAEENDNEHNENDEAEEGTGEDENDYDDGIGDEDTGDNEDTGDDADDADDEGEEDSEEEPNPTLQQSRPEINYMSRNRRWFLPCKDDPRLAVDRERVNVDEEYDMSKLIESEG
jgi:hypothetical protein